MTTTDTARDVIGASLADWRTLDWRFLLPAGAIRVVAFAGPVPDDEAAALRALGALVVPAGANSANADAAIVTDGDAGRLGNALASLRPGGWLLVRTVSLTWRPRGGLETGRGWRRGLRRYGLTDVRAYWHAPSREVCSYLVPTDDADALRFVLKRWRGTAHGLVKSVVARGLLRVGLLPYATRDLTLVGRVPGGDTDGTSVVLAAAPVGHPVSAVLLTPWFEASRHVIGVLLRGSQPVVVVKVPRRPGDDSGLRREADALERLRSLPFHPAHAPRVLTAPAGAPPGVLVEEAIVGEALGPELVRADPVRALRVGMAVVDAMPVTGTTNADPGWFERLVEAPLRGFAERGPDDAATRTLVARTRERLAPLAAADLPLVFEHADLGHPNLVLRPDGTLTALDWERAEGRGLPGHDAAFLLGYLADARRGAFALDARLRAFEAAFLGPHRWAWQAFREHLARRRVREDLAAALLLASWARSSCGLLDRLLAAADDQTLARPAAWAEEIVRHHRDPAVWRLVDAAWDRLD